MSQKINFDLFEQVSRGVKKGLDRTKRELEREVRLNTPVDTGYLRDGAEFGSGRGNEIARKGFSLKIKNEAVYASHVHEGYQMRNGRRIEGRPWIHEAIDKVNPQKIIQEELERELKQNR